MDIDFAEHELARCLGLASLDSVASDYKNVYWSINDLGMDLVKILDGLVAGGFLEKRDEPDFQYRWIGKYDSLFKKIGQ